MSSPHHRHVSADIGPGGARNEVEIISAGDRMSRSAHHIVICSSESSATESLMDDWH